MIKKLPFVSFLLIILNFAAAAQSVDVTKLPTITVTGTAEIQVVPDEVTFSLRVAKSDSDLQTAKTQNDQNIAKLIALTKTFGIAQTDVKTDFISVKEKYECIQPKGEPVCRNTFVGYTVTKTIVVKLKDISKFENFLSEIIKIGITEVGDVSFQSSQLRKYKDQMRANAIRAAQEKATAMAKEIGQSIGKAISIEENNVDRYYNSNSNISSNSFSVSDDDDSETVSVGTISVRAQVEIKFVLN